MSGEEFSGVFGELGAVGIKFPAITEGVHSTPIVIAQLIPSQGGGSPWYRIRWCCRTTWSFKHKA